MKWKCDKCGPFFIGLVSPTMSNQLILWWRNKYSGGGLKIRSRTFAMAAALHLKFLETHQKGNSLTKNKYPFMYIRLVVGHTNCGLIRAVLVPSSDKSSIHPSIRPPTIRNYCLFALTTSSSAFNSSSLHIFNPLRNPLLMPIQQFLNGFPWRKDFPFNSSRIIIDNSD